MTTIGNIGIGLFVLIIVWILALIIFVIGVKFQSNIAWIALGSAASLTLLLWLIPTEKQFFETEELETQEKDYILIYKTILLIVLTVTALIGCISFFLLHCIEPIRTRPIKDFYNE